MIPFASSEWEHRLDMLQAECRRSAIRSAAATLVLLLIATLGAWRQLHRTEAGSTQVQQAFPVALGAFGITVVAALTSNPVLEGSALAATLAATIVVAMLAASDIRHA